MTASTLGLIALIMLLVALIGITGALASLYQLPSAPEPEVGSWRRRPAPRPRRNRLPASYESLLNTERNGWNSDHRWQQLVQMLDRIETDLGRTPSPAPEYFDEAWLEHRVQELEALAGPMPHPYVPPRRKPPRPTIWQRLSNRFVAAPGPRAPTTSPQTLTSQSATT